jgi:phosphoribosylformylglycinamidine synthase
MEKKHNFSIREYKKISSILKREPNELELGIFSVLWSEHCSYKSSKIYLKDLPTKAEYVIQGPGENAGVIRINKDWGLVFKIESHNHPSAIEPYQGAATGVGGIIRDILSMGARPIALADSLRFGKNPHSKYLFENVVAGIAGYGNTVGIPTVAGDVYFDPCFEHNPLVNVMCVGLVRLNKLKKAKVSGIGNVLMYVGASTGRDGLAGAAFASEELKETLNKENLPAVQIADPFLEKLLIEAILEVNDKDYIIGMQDLGGGGLATAIFELASKSKLGLEIDLSKIPRRTKNLSYYELLLSESQERMLLCIKREYQQETKKIFSKWGLNAVVLGKVIKEKKVIIKDKNKVILTLPYNLAKKTPVYRRKTVEYKIPHRKFNFKKVGNDYNHILYKLLSSPTIANKNYVYQQYDYMVLLNTVIPPGIADACLLRLLIDNKNKFIGLTLDGNSLYTYINPRLGASLAVIEACLNLACVGTKPMALTNCLNFASPEDPKIMWQFKESVLGLKEAAENLNIPVVSGNVSFYNETKGEKIYPTLIIGMIGLMDKELPKKFIHAGFRNPKDLIILIGNQIEGVLSASQYMRELSQDVYLLKEEIPNEYINYQQIKNQINLILEAFNQGILESAHDISEGGLSVSLAESCILGNKGAIINLPTNNNTLSLLKILFGEINPRLIVSINEKNLNKFKELAYRYKVNFQLIGRVTANNNLTINDWIDIKLERLKSAWLR